jgi:hypothetical protein
MTDDLERRRPRYRRPSHVMWAHWWQPSHVCTQLSVCARAGARREHHEHELRAGTSRKGHRAGLGKVLGDGLAWPSFRTANVAYLATGSARPNLSVDYLTRLSQFLRAADQTKLGGILLASRFAQPVDTHPVLADRLRALGADPAQTVNAAISEMLKQVSPDDGLISLEQTLRPLRTNGLASRQANRC